MPKVTIATFNAENLFNRYNFRGRRIKRGAKYVYEPYTPEQLAAKIKDGFIIDKNLLNTYQGENRTLTARVIKEMDADIVGLQEIENLGALKKFNRDFMASKRYPYQLVVDGNDPRFIDVGLLSRFEVDFIRTHQFDRNPGNRGYLYSRDCLEVHIRLTSRTTLPVFINHFKSMMGGRSQTRQRRLNQANGVVGLLENRFGRNYGHAEFVVVGDFNDYLEPGRETESGVAPLLANPQLVNVVDRLPPDQRWTHYYKGDRSYHQLDYILLSRALATKRGNRSVKPIVERRGQPPRVNRAGEPVRVERFFPGVTNSRKASDHCGVAVTINV